MYNIGIVGLGFLGGSLAKSLSKSPKVEKIIATDINTKSLELAKSEGVISDYSLEVDSKFGSCDIVFIATPVSYIAEYARKLEKVIKPDCIITDTGSTKKTIIAEAKNMQAEFIGGHPMIGSERSGYETSVDILFENSYYIITKSNKNKEKSVNLLKELVEEIGALPVIIDENKHDYITSCISHVPHIVAAGLVTLVKNSDDKEENMKMLAAGGFKDITRIASSDPTMWENICTENKEEILKNLDKFIYILENFRNNINSKEATFSYFENSKKYRDSFINKKINGNTMPELNISVKDENGAIAKVTTILSDNEIGIKNIEVINNRENNFGALKVIVRSYEEREKGYEILKNLGYDIKKVN